MPTEFHVYFSNLISDASISQRELATRLGYDPSYISRLKKEQIPSPTFLKELSEVLDLSTESEKRLFDLAQKARAETKEQKMQRKQDQVAEHTDRKELKVFRDRFYNTVRKLLEAIGFDLSGDIPTDIRGLVDFRGVKYIPEVEEEVVSWFYVFYPPNQRKIYPQDIAPFVDAKRWLQSNQQNNLGKFFFCYPDDTQLTQEAQKYLDQEGIKGRPLQDWYHKLIDFRPYFDALSSTIAEKPVHSDYYQDLYGRYFTIGNGSGRASSSALPKERTVVSEAIKSWAREKVSDPVLVVTGEPGTGKTTLCEHIALNWADDHQRGLFPRIPILIRMADYHKSADFGNLVVDTLQSHGVQVDRRKLQLFDQRGLFLFILDGLDEMLETIDIRKIRRSIKDIEPWIHSNSKLLITCRNEYYVTAISEYSSEKIPPEIQLGQRLHIEGFTSEQLKRMVDLRAPENNEEIISPLQKYPDLWKVYQRPLFADILINIWYNGHFSTSRTQLLESTLSAYLKRERQEKNRELIKTDHKIELAQLLSKHMYAKGMEYNWTIEDTREMVFKYFQDKEPNLTNEKVEHYTREFSLTMFLTPDNGGMEFSESKYKEFFLARYLYRQLEKTNARSIDLARIPISSGVGDMIGELIGSSSTLITHIHTHMLKRSKTDREHYLGANGLLLLLASGCSIRELDTQGASLHNSQLQNRNLTGADFRGEGTPFGTDLAYSDFSNADLSEVQIDEDTYFEYVEVSGDTKLPDSVADKIEHDKTHQRSTLSLPSGMVYIPSGEFPLREITREIKPFFIKKHPVTNKEFKEFINSKPEWKVNGKKQNEYKENWPAWQYYLTHWRQSGEPNEPPETLLEHPVVNVPYTAAIAFIEWRSLQIAEELGVDADAITLRLPTEPEWVWAIFGGDLSKYYPWGDHPPEKYANINNNIGHTTPVTKFLPNNFGVYVLGGNIKEWCQKDEDSKDSETGIDYAKRKGAGFQGTSEEVTPDYYDYMPLENINPDNGFRYVMEQV